jgi:tetratricopeptide (TPR) repeat protein
MVGERMNKSKNSLIFLIILLCFSTGCSMIPNIKSLLPIENTENDIENKAKPVTQIPEDTLNDILHDFYTYQDTEGVRKLNTVLAEMPDDPMALALRGAFEVHDVDEQKALEYANLALEENEDVAFAHAVRAWYFNYATDWFVVAENECKEALSLDPNSSFVYTVCGQIYSSLADNEESFRMYKKAVELEPDDVLALYYLAYKQIYLEYNEDAIITVEHAIEVNPDQDFLYFLRAYVYFHNNNYEAALVDLNYLIEKGSEDVQHYVYRASSLSKTGKFEESIPDYRYIIAKEPDNDWALNTLAYYLALFDQDLNEALSYAEKAVSIDPDNDYYIDTKAFVFYKLGRYDEALELFTGLIERDATYSYFGRAFVYYDLGEYDLAKKDIELFMQLYPDDNLKKYAADLLDKLNQFDPVIQ